MGSARRERDPGAGLVIGEAFQRLAEPFIGRIAEEVKEGAVQDAPGELGELVACAVNLAFALELFIKTLLVQLQLEVPQRHDLGILYDALPKEVKDKIEETYDTAWRSQWYGKRAAITIAKGPRDEPGWTDYRNESKGIAALLERSKDVFQGFRYIYEFTEPEDDGHQFHQFEYGLLLCACNSLKAAIIERLQGPPTAS